MAETTDQDLIQAARNRAVGDCLSNIEIVRVALFGIKQIAEVSMVRVTAEERRIYLRGAPEFSDQDTPDFTRIQLHGREFRCFDFKCCQILWPV